MGKGRHPFRWMTAAVTGIIVAGLVAPPAGAGELGVVRTGSRERPAMFDGAIRDVFEMAGAEALIPRLEAWLDGEQSDDTQLELATRVTVPDWSGDGLADDLSTRYVFELVDVELRTTTTLTAVEGDTGRVLWRRRWDNAVSATPAKVGPQARDGVILTEFSGAALVETTNIDYTFRAFTGAGRKLWTRKLTSTVAGQWPVTYVGYDYVTGIGAFDGLPGEATDLVVSRGTVLVPPQWRLRSGAVQANVIDGRDGGLTEHPVPEVGLGFVPYVGAMSDFDRDGRDDYIFMTQRPGAAPADGNEPEPVRVGTGTVVGRKGTDGTTLWTTGGLDYEDRNLFLEDLGHIVGTEEGDVFVETESVYYGTEKNPDELFTYLIEGSEGLLVWKRRGGWPYSPGDIDRDGSRDLLLQHHYGIDGFVATDVRALTNRGKQLWRREYRTEHLLQTCCSWLWHFGGGWGAGDFDGDGLSDGYIDHFAGNWRTGVGRHDNFVIDPSSGEYLARGGAEFMPLGGSADGGTADYALVSWDGGELAVEVRDGLTGATLTTSRVALDVPVDPKTLQVYAGAARFDGDRCAEPILQVHATAAIYEIVLKGADGELLWAQPLSRRAGDARVVSSTDTNEAC